MHVQGAGVTWEISIFPSQLCCEPKTTAKILVSQKERKISKYFRRYILHSMTDKGLKYLKYIKDFLQVSKKKVNNPMEKKWARAMNRHLTDEKTQRPVHMCECSNLQ